MGDGADNSFGVNGKPVLVDFDNSILCKENVYASDGASLITRADNSGIRGFDGSPGSYFIGAKRDREMRPSEIVALYRGADAR